MNQKDRSFDNAQMAAYRELVPYELTDSTSLSIMCFIPFIDNNTITEPLDVVTVSLWKQVPEVAPDWFKQLLENRNKHLKEKAERIARQEKERAAKETREQFVSPYSPGFYRRAASVIRSAKGRMLYGYERQEVEEEAYWLFREFIVAGLPLPGELDEYAIVVCDYFRVDPYDHSTWAVHAGGCTGEGRDCEEGSQEAEIAEAMEKLEQRELRQQWSSENAELLKSGKFDIGQWVSIWGGRVAGIVVGHNKITAKVRLVARTDNELVVKPIRPHFMEPMEEVDIAVGDVFTIKIGGHFREAEIIEVDGPCMKVQYSIKSGAVREKWTDVTAIVDNEVR